nr:MAG TPA: hypothetical protein [Caudoviricetes sp.]DAT59091.1 MAG TPA: hypothetical protein [Caudoviricetes sp.]
MKVYFHHLFLSLYKYSSKKAVLCHFSLVAIVINSPSS